MIAGVEIKGSIGRFFINSHGIEIPQEMVTVNTALLSDADVAIALTDSTTEDTTASSPVNWKSPLGKWIWHAPGTVQHAGRQHDRFGRNPCGDPAERSHRLRTSPVHSGNFRLAGRFAILRPAIRENRRRPGCQPYCTRDIGLGIDSITFDGNTLGLSLALRETHMKEKSGLEIRSLTGHFNMDSTSLHVSGLVLRTPDSYIRTQADMDLASVAEQPQGKMSARLMGELGKQDVLLFAGGLPPAFVKAYPNSPIILRLSADGNLDTLNLTTAEARLAGAFELKADGKMFRLTDSVRRSGHVNLALRTRNLDFARALAGEEALEDIALPPMRLDGNVGLDGQKYTADLRLREGKGSVQVKGGFDAARMAYQAKLAIKDLQLRHFLPKDSLYGLSLTASAKASERISSADIPGCRPT